VIAAGSALHDHALSIFRKMPAGTGALAFIAGGCFRSFIDGTSTKDYDLFFASHGDWSLAVQFFRWDSRFKEITKPGEEAFPSFTNGVDAPFNLIGFRFHKNARSLAASFDFRCCGFAAEMVDIENVDVFAVDGAINDATDRVLNFLNHQHIDRVMRRSNRYTTQYGYRLSDQFVADLSICRSLPVDTSAGGY
jgi:hypothetical protein